MQRKQQQQQSQPQAAGQALRMLAAYMDAYTQATIAGGTTKASVEMRGLRVETKINLSGSTEVCLGSLGPLQHAAD